jgi:phosphoribosylformylglycinamidine synthase
LHQTTLTLIREGWLQSAHDVSEGGLFINLLESGFPRQLGFSIQMPTDFRHDAWLFGESQGRIVVSIAKDRAADFEARMNATNLPYQRIGEVTTGDVQVGSAQWGTIGTWLDKYEQAIPNYLAGHAPEQALGMI